MTSGRIVFAHDGFGYLLDADLVDRAVQLASTRFVIPGGTPGSVWFVGHRTFQAGGPFVQWVASVEVETGTVGDPIDVTDGRWWPVAGVGNGLIVKPIDEETYGRFAFWSPSEGLAPLDIADSARKTIMAGSGDYAVVVSRDEVGVLNIADGEYAATFSLDFGDVDVTSVCLSPDQEYVAVVASNGEAIVGNTSSGRVIDLTRAANSKRPAIRSVAWTSADQLVYVIELRDEIVVETFDVTTRGRRRIAVLEGSQAWWLTAGAAMC
jgi:hypothetical protein